MQRTHIWFAHYAHARKRARERYGISLGFGDVEEIARQISGGRARYLGGHQGDRDVWLVRVRGKECRVVWDGKTDSVVTFLPSGDCLIVARRS